MLGAIEAGGTKFLCGVGTGPADLRSIEIPTRTPEETMPEVAAYFRVNPVKALGLGCFGPVNLNRRTHRPSSVVQAGYGHITSTPKLAWRGFNIVGWLERELGVPVAFDTDVNAAAIAEGALGAAQGMEDFVYFTVGTGIGGGAVSGGRVVHGMVHPEMGHLPVRRHPADTFAGHCPAHGDCLEGLAAGPAIAARLGMPAPQIPPDDASWEIVAYYLAQAAVNASLLYSPEAVVFGGGVLRQEHLLARVQKFYDSLLNGYLSFPAKLLQSKLSNAGLVGSLMLSASAADKPFAGNGNT